MLKMIIRNTDGSLEEIAISKNMKFVPEAGQQFYFNEEHSNYTFNLTDGEKSIKIFFKDGTETYEIVFENLADLIKQNNPLDENALDTILGVANDKEGFNEIFESLNNKEFDGGEIIEHLKQVLAESNGEALEADSLNGVLIDDFGSLASNLEAAAAGGAEGDASTFNAFAFDDSDEVNAVDGPGSLTLGRDNPDPGPTPNGGNQVNITLTATEQITENDSFIIYTATLDTPALTTMTLTLSNGSIITIPAGASSGSVSSPITPDPDVYTEPATTVTALVSTVSGGGFTTVDTGTPASTTVVDTIDVTTVDLSATASTSEDGGSITYTATLTNEAKETVTVTLTNGETITIEPKGTVLPDGSVSDGLNGSVTIPVNRDDVYKETDSITNSISTVTGGASFESLQKAADTNVSTDILDDQDPVTVILVPTDENGNILTSSVVPEGQKAYYKAVVVDENGNILPDVAGKEHGTVDVTFTNGTAGSSDYSSTTTNVKIGVPFSADALNDNIVENPEKFQVTISNPQSDLYEKVEVGTDTEIKTVLLTESFEGLRTNDGWHVINNTFTGDNNVKWNVDASGVEIQKGIVATSPDGNSHAELDPHDTANPATGNAAITTTVDLANNDKFELEFSYKARTGNDSSDMKVIFDGKEVLVKADGTFVITPDDGSITVEKTAGKNGWTDYKVVYTGVTSTTTDLTFEGAGKSDTLGALLDDIKLTGIDTNNSATVETTITDTDTATVSISQETNTVAEAGTHTYTLTLSQQSSTETKVTVVVGHVQTDDGDLTPVTKTVTIPANTSSITFDVTNKEDNLVENNENYKVEITGTDNPAITPNSNAKELETTIIDNDGKITLEAPSDVTENETKVTYTLKVDTAPQGDLEVTVNVNGTDRVITIPDGQMQVTFDVDVRADDKYDQGEQTIEANIVSHTGGNYSGTLVYDNSNNDVVIRDDEDKTTITIDAPEDVSENATSVTYTLKVDNAPQGDLDVTVNVNGVDRVVRIPDGQTQVTFDVDVRVDNAYNDTNDNIVVNVTGHNGGNYEDVVYNNADNTVVVGDDNDTTTVSVTTANVNENADTVTFNFQTSNPPQAGTAATLTITLNGVEQTVNLDATGKGSLVVNTKDSDVYNDSQSYAVVVTAINGGNFENTSVTGANATATVTDTGAIDTTTITLDAPEDVDENATSVTYTVRVDNAPQDGSPLTVQVQVAGENTPRTVIITHPATSATFEVDVRADDVYKQNPDNIVAEIKNHSGGNYENVTYNNTDDTVVVRDDVDPVNVTVTAKASNPKIIDVDTEFGDATGVTVTAYNPDGSEGTIAVVKNTNHDGFGVDGRASGDDKELGFTNGKSEKLVFTFDKDVDSLDVAFAWRHNGEKAKVTFFDDGQEIGYAVVKGGGSNALAKVEYYDTNGTLLKTVQAQGGTDRVDLSYTFEFPGANGKPAAFDKVEFSAVGNGDDYLINKIAYTEVIDPEVTNISTSEGKVTFNIQVDENYPPQGQANAIVEVNGQTHVVPLNATGRGTLSVDAKDFADLSDIDIKVLRVEGGNYEKVNGVEATFDLSDSFDDDLNSTDDAITVDEDITYTLTETDFGELGTDVTGVKVTELPQNGTLYYTATAGTTVIDKDGNTYVTTEETTVELSVNQTVTLAEIGAGKITFKPDTHTDEDGSFKFRVSDGTNLSDDEYTTTIDVKAIADKPTVSIDVSAGRTVEPDTTIDVDEKLGHQKGDNVISGTNPLTQYDEASTVKTIDLGKEFAGQTIKISLDATVSGSWNHSGSHFDDNWGVVVNGEKVATFKYASKGGTPGDTYETVTENGVTVYKYGTSGGNRSFTKNHITPEIEITLDENGRATVQFTAATTETAEHVTVNEIIVDAPEMVQYDVDISASLVDRDGSETLTVQISGVPAGATLTSDTYTLTDKGSGVWEVTVPADAKDISDDSIKMTVPKDATDFNLEIKATATEARDGTSDFATDSEAVVVDTTPSAMNEINTLTLGESSTNLVVTFDVSGSMDYQTGGRWSPTRFDIAKQSMIDTINAYKANGQTEVNLTLFNGGSKNYGWMSADQAISFFNRLTMDDMKVYLDGREINALREGNTNYHAGLQKTMTVDFTDHEADSTVAYFISDGAPNNQAWRTDQDTDTTIRNWKTFVDTNVDKLNVVGISSGAQVNPLKIVQVQDGDEVLIVRNVDTLGNVLAGTVTASLDGNVLENIDFKADAPGEIKSITIDGVEYTKETFPTDGKTTSTGAVLEFNFDTGVYKYTTNTKDVTSDISETFKVKAVDSDNDEVQFDLQIKVDVAPNASENIVSINDNDTIDLSTVLDNNANTDGINMTNNKANVLDIDLEDIVDLNSDKEYDLKIFGDDDDKVSLEGGDEKWDKLDSVEIDGQNFNVYQGTDGTSNIKILIDEDVSIDPDV